MLLHHAIGTFELVPEGGEEDGDGKRGEEPVAGRHPPGRLALPASGDDQPPTVVSPLHHRGADLRR